jgi:nucleoside 2-deoxyribosyltransferase
MLTIYLAGIMDDVKDDPSIMNSWRDKTAQAFTNYNVKTLNPCRRPHSSECTLTDKEIFELDMIDVRASDFILADCRLHKGRSQFGTPSEIFYANYILQKPVIGWYNEGEGYRENSVFQNVLVTNMLPSLDLAIEHIFEFYVH